MTTTLPESQQQYGSLLTVLGENAEQNGKLQNKQITFTHIAIGDANDTYVQPDRKQTGLVNELTRIPVNSVDVLQPSPDSIPMLKVEAILPDDVNDIVIREFAAVAMFNGQEYFHAVGNCARIYVPKPLNNGNVSNPVTLEMIFVITSAEPIVEIDPNVITASREYVDVSTKALGDALIDGFIYPRRSVENLAVGMLVPQGTDAFRID
ncbi:phage tail-collar fiber domain-containing protein, partial [Photobacterium ganghwense]|uniref:phage tail-collar fiber domain-containing protein n=1 Tax=Photobacterium ganghwense TaxID=320778 RepID=UPI001C2D8E05